MEPLFALVHQPSFRMLAQATVAWAPGRTQYALAVQVANLSLKNPERVFVDNLNEILAQRSPRP